MLNFSQEAVGNSERIVINCRYNAGESITKYSQRCVLVENATFKNKILESANFYNNNLGNPQTPFKVRVYSFDKRGGGTRPTQGVNHSTSFGKKWVAQCKLRNVSDTCIKNWLLRLYGVGFFWWSILLLHCFTSRRRQGANVWPDVGQCPADIEEGTTWVKVNGSDWKKDIIHYDNRMVAINALIKAKLK